MLLHPSPEKKPVTPSKKLVEEEPPINPEDALESIDTPDTIPDDDPFETPPYETPEPGEGP